MTDQQAIKSSTEILKSLGAGFYLDPKDLAALTRTIELASIFPKLHEVAYYECHINDNCETCQYHESDGLYCVSGRAKDALSQINRVMQFLEKKEKENNND